MSSNFINVLPTNLLNLALLSSSLFLFLIWQKYLIICKFLLGQVFFPALFLFKYNKYSGKDRCQVNHLSINIFVLYPALLTRDHVCPDCHKSVVSNQRSSTNIPEDRGRDGCYTQRHSGTQEKNEEFFLQKISQELTAPASR